MGQGNFSYLICLTIFSKSWREEQWCMMNKQKKTLSANQKWVTIISIRDFFRFQSENWSLQIGKVKSIFLVWKNVNSKERMLRLVILVKNIVIHQIDRRRIHIHPYPKTTGILQIRNSFQLIFAYMHLTIMFTVLSINRPVSNACILGNVISILFIFPKELKTESFYYTYAW